MASRARRSSPRRPRARRPARIARLASRPRAIGAARAAARHVAQMSTDRRRSAGARALRLGGQDCSASRGASRRRPGDAGAAARPPGTRGARRAFARRADVALTPSVRAASTVRAAAHACPAPHGDGSSEARGAALARLGRGRRAEEGRVFNAGSRRARRARPPPRLRAIESTASSSVLARARPIFRSARRRAHATIFRVRRVANFRGSAEARRSRRSRDPRLRRRRACSRASAPGPEVGARAAPTGVSRASCSARTLGRLVRRSRPNPDRSRR